MRFTNTLLPLILAAVASARPTPQTPEDPTLTFTPQIPSDLETSIRPLGEKPIANVDNRSFVFPIPDSAAGKTCIPFLGPNPVSNEFGLVEVATLQPDENVEGGITLDNVYTQPIDSVLGMYKLAAKDVDPTVSWSEVNPTGGFPCPAGKTIGLRLEGKSGYFVMYNSSGRFRLNVVESVTAPGNGTTPGNWTAPAV